MNNCVLRASRARRGVLFLMCLEFRQDEDDTPNTLPTLMHSLRSGALGELACLSESSACYGEGCFRIVRMTWLLRPDLNVSVDILSFAVMGLNVCRSSQLQSNVAIFAVIAIACVVIVEQLCIC